MELYVLDVTYGEYDDRAVELRGVFSTLELAEQARDRAKAEIGAELIARLGPSLGKYFATNAQFGIMPVTLDEYFTDGQL